MLAVDCAITLRRLCVLVRCRRHRSGQDFTSLFAANYTIRFDPSSFPRPYSTSVQAQF